MVWVGGVEPPAFRFGSMEYYLNNLSISHFINYHQNYSQFDRNSQSNWLSFLFFNQSHPKSRWRPGAPLSDSTVWVQFYFISQLWMLFKYLKSSSETLLLWSTLFLILFKFTNHSVLSFFERPLTKGSE